jgi:D-alanyl-D-alanine carboxypeptidase (penicillin-binding protein 5/6)
MNRLSFFIILVFLTNIICNSTVFAAKKSSSKAAPSGRTETSLIVDGKTGKILHSYNAKKRIYPASLTKVMTLYLIFEALDSGKITMDQKFSVSKYAADAKPGKLYLKPGEKISVKDVILGLIVKSANDAARTAAENISGSEQKFAKLMTLRAHQLGMQNTIFTNASGWHDPRQKTTAVDLVKLSIAIKRDFPKYYQLFTKTSFKFKGKTIPGHNKLVAKYPGAEGLKTGFTNPAGCNLITTATRGNKSLVGVVTGSSSAASRDQKMIKLLDTHFMSKPPIIKAKKTNAKSSKTAHS